MRKQEIDGAQLTNWQLSGALTVCIFLNFLKNPVKLKKIWSVGKEAPPAAPLDPLLQRTSN